MATAAKVFIVFIFVLSAVFFGLAIAAMTHKDDNWKYQYMREVRTREMIKFDTIRLSEDIRKEQGYIDASSKLHEGELHQATTRMENYRGELEKDIETAQKQYRDRTQARDQRLKQLDVIALQVSNFAATIKAYREALAGFERKSANLQDYYQDIVRQYESLAVEVARMHHEKSRLIEDARAIEEAYFAAQEETSDLTESIIWMVAENPDLPELALGAGANVRNASLVKVSPGGIVVLSKGANEKVARGMHFSVFRGAQFLAKVQVITVTSNRAVAQLVDPWQGVTLKEGDRAERSQIFRRRRSTREPNR